METHRILMRSLAVAVIITSVIWTTTATGTAIGAGVVYSCCTTVSTSELTDHIINIRLQRESLPCVKAVVFETERGDFCTDPRQRWVQEKVKQFFRAQRNKPTSTPPPTSSVSHQTHVGGATQATDSSSVTNV